MSTAQAFSATVKNTGLTRPEAPFSCRVLTLPGWSPHFAEGHNTQHTNVSVQMHSTTQSPCHQGGRPGVTPAASSVLSPSPAQVDERGFSRPRSALPACSPGQSGPVASASSGSCTDRLSLRTTRLLDITCQSWQGLFVPISHRAQPQIPKLGSTNLQFRGLANTALRLSFPESNFIVS